MDIDNLPTPMYLSITARYFNYDNVALYFQITGLAPNYTFGTVNLGSVASGANAIQNLDHLASRPTPSASSLTKGTMQETITLTLNAYTDAGYSNLKWTFNRTVTVYWINSADPSFTVNELDNFDDGTVDGWAAEGLEGVATISCAIATDYVLSAPYSLKTTSTATPYGYVPAQISIYKQFTTPNATKVFAVFDFRLGDLYYGGAGALKNVRIRINGNALVFIGKSQDSVWTTTDYVPSNRWIRIVVPLPVNTTLTLDLFEELFTEGFGADFWYIWMDDFKIISQ
jgi:hypothetical protein